MARLIDKLIQEEAKERETRVDGFQSKNTKSLLQMINIGSKDKMISGKINSGLWNTFSEICKKQGLSKNSCLNLLISNYVEQKKYLLD